MTTQNLTEPLNDRDHRPNPQLGLWAREDRRVPRAARPEGGSGLSYPSPEEAAACVYRGP